MTETRKPHTYGSGIEKRAEDPALCIQGVHQQHSWGVFQCKRKRGRGPDGLYCKQHDPEARKARQTVKDAELKRLNTERYERALRIKQ